MNFKSLLLGTVITIGSIFGGSVEARPNRIVMTTTSNGTEISVRPVGYNGVSVTVDNKYRGTGFIGNMNCSTGAYQWRANDGFSKRTIRNILVDVCNF